MQDNRLKESYHEELPDSFEAQTLRRSPSNIAIVKYWGKHGNQLPNNPSISFTLSNCYTETKISYQKIQPQDSEKSKQSKIDFFFEGKENQSFKTKIEKFFDENKDFFPFLNQLYLKIESHNSFPHSSGIASSASSMSALVLCLLDIEKACLDDKTPIDLQKASFFARLASGSASRSVYPTMALWGQTPDFKGSSDEYAVSLEQLIHPVFKSYHDSILIVSSKEKSVSSRAGHALMDNHPQAEARYATANKNIKRLLQVLQAGDIDTFTDIAEAEALQLHELMASSTPPYKLVEINTLKIIDEVRSFRKNSGIPVCFTLDAGPNVHLLYPDDCAEKVKEFILNQLQGYCLDNRWIDDKVGN